MQPLRFAILGCGRMGRHHSERLREDGRGEVVALLDMLPEMALRLQQDLWPRSRLYKNVTELMCSDTIDAAILCTPTAEHFTQASQCLDRGWHVLCEKPLASNRDQILGLIGRVEKARARNIVFSLGYQRRHAAIYKTLRREVLSGAWGNVRAVVSHNVENWQPTIGGTWRDDPDQNFGGFLIDAGSHKLDSIFYVTGLDPVEAFARSQTWGSRVEIVTSATALLTNEVTLTLDFIGNAQYLGEDLGIHCEHADLLVRHGELWLGHEGCLKRLDINQPESNPVTSLLDSILNGAPVISPPSAALPVFDLTQAILRSAQSQTSVAIADL